MEVADECSALVPVGFEGTGDLDAALRHVVERVQLGGLELCVVVRARSVRGATDRTGLAQRVRVRTGSLEALRLPAPSTARTL